MCGIVGATARRGVVNTIIGGLKTLEYRGYDSAGIAVQGKRGVQVRKRAGKISELERHLAERPVDGHCVIGHTRWATHGSPSRANAHPHVSHGEIAVVHNGIIENSMALREMLERGGYGFNSQTDTEVVPHLVHHFLAAGQGFFEACRSAIGLLEGSYALAITSIHEPGKIVVARHGSPLVIGAGDGAYFVASDLPALLSETNQFYFLEDGDIAELSADHCRICDTHGIEVERVLTRGEHDVEAIGKNGYQHFMQKEIFEQPEVIGETLRGRIAENTVAKDLVSAECRTLLERVEQVHIVACGTSWHAGSIARYWIESLAGLPCQVEIASEYRYRQPVVREGTLFLCISQSGETADTLAALRFAQTLDYLGTLAVCNVPSSSLCREADESILTRAGMEIGVASTKAFTTQLTVLALLTLALAEQRGVDPQRLAALTGELQALPERVREALSLEDDMAEMARHITRGQHALFLGRGQQHPVAQEAALKLKEISYIHAEAYAAGELKHGPLALVDDQMPVVAVCPSDELLEKLESNLQEVSARGGRLYVLADRRNADRLGCAVSMHVGLEAHGLFTSPIVFSVPLQLLAYHAALIRGTDVDQPRNLAKSVTVE